MVYPIGKLIVPPIYKLWLKKVEGLENVPDKTFIIAANHSSYYDILIPPILIVPKINIKIHALVNSYYWEPFITRFFLDMWEAIPVYVEKEKNSKQKNKIAFERAIKYLNKGESVMIFPEGSRSRDGKLKKAYNGAARIALKANAPVLPVGIIGANKVLPIGKIFPRFRRCDVKIGKLIHFEKYYKKKESKKALVEITRKIMKEIAKLIGQEYNH